MPKRILLIGGPSTGKTTLLNHLSSLGYFCLEEISREVIRQAKNEGIEQLFLEKPLLFSSLIKEARIAQFKEVTSDKNGCVFYDRGIPDTVAYLNFINQEYPKSFIAACKEYIYDKVFVLPPWKEIHVTDKERYENFKQAKEIHKELIATYTKYGYTPIEVPKGNLEERTQFIITKLRA